MKSALLFLLVFTSFSAQAFQNDRPSIAAGTIQGELKIDGIMNEPDWQNAPVLDDFTMIEPTKGGDPTGKTEARIIANATSLVIGIMCYDPDPSAITSFSKLRDASLESEDHVRIVIDAFQDGQSGYILSVNANGARYDALVANRGESENEDWDAIWEAVTSRNGEGWSVEIRIPIQSISFRKGLDTWGFNIERRVQRNLETVRWANASIDQWFIQTSRAGLLTNLPEFSYGVGLNIRPSFITGILREAGEDRDYSFKPSLDLSQRLGPNAVATVTFNTDFAETEVDTRQTNLTRFPLFFPEKRAFFLEGADIFEFGLGLQRDIRPFFSRRIGTFEGDQVPVLAGLKLNGRFGKTAIGAVTMHTDAYQNPERSIDLASSTMGSIRIKQNILKESSIGMISTFGDPDGLYNDWMAGIDFTYQTTELQGNKNFLAGFWGLYAENAETTGDQSAVGMKIDYPNDRWDIALSYYRIGDGFQPSMGFAPRNGVHYYRAAATFSPRPKASWLRQMRNQFFFTYYVGLDGEWQSYRVFTAPINWRLESGERVEINFNPQGETLTEPFDIAEGVSIPVGRYNFMRYRLEAEIAAKRKLSGQITWWFGTFYSGNLDEIEATINWNPSALIAFEFSGVRNIGNLAEGKFDQTLTGLRVRFNVTPDLQINAFGQYDTDSKEFGLNSRIHWIFHPQGDFFIVYNYNAGSMNITDRFAMINNQILVKLRYNFRL